MRALRLSRIEITVADLAAATRFYAAIPGVVVGRVDAAAPSMAALLGAERIEQQWLQRGEQTILLQRFEPPGAPYPADRRSCDQSFQHLALPVADAAQAAAAARGAAISKGGAVKLPDSSGGAVAYKFRDDEGHPLEFIQFADGHGGGVDHSAIVSADAARSIAFYRDRLGLTLAARQTNEGPEQDRLDGLDGTVVDVVALEPAEPTPHVELLAYRHPRVRTGAAFEPRDVAATRLVFDVDEGTAPSLLRDPDGHLLLLVPSPAG